VSDYWFLCRDSGTIKYFGSFPDCEEADAYLVAHGIDLAWIFSDDVVVESKPQSPPVIDYDNRCEEQEDIE